MARSRTITSTSLILRCEGEFFPCSVDSWGYPAPLLWQDCADRFDPKALSPHHIDEYTGNSDKVRAPSRRKMMPVSGSRWQFLGHRPCFSNSPCPRVHHQSVRGVVPYRSETAGPADVMSRTSTDLRANRTTLDMQGGNSCIRSRSIRST